MSLLKRIWLRHQAINLLSNAALDCEPLQIDHVIDIFLRVSTQELVTLRLFLL